MIPWTNKVVTETTSHVSMIYSSQWVLCLVTSRYQGHNDVIDGETRWECLPSHHEIYYSQLVPAVSLMTKLNRYTSEDKALFKSSRGTHNQLTNTAIKLQLFPRSEGGSFVKCNGWPPGCSANEAYPLVSEKLGPEVNAIFKSCLHGMGSMIYQSAKVSHH